MTNNTRRMSCIDNEELLRMEEECFPFIGATTGVTSVQQGNERVASRQRKHDRRGHASSAGVLERVGSPEVTLHELFSRFKFTIRESEVVSLVLLGMTSKEIAKEIGVSQKSVKSFLSVAMKKAGSARVAPPLSQNTGSSQYQGVIKKSDPLTRNGFNELCRTFNLTNREREAVGFLVQGMTSKEIAQQMGISPNTVTSFLRLVMTKAMQSKNPSLTGTLIGTVASSQLKAPSSPATLLALN